MFRKPVCIIIKTGSCISNLYLILLISGCITTNYYTGRTLEEGKTVLTPGVDNIIIMEEEEGLLKKNFSFSLSLGIATGLPWRFEAGLRTYFPYIWEADIRYQITPRSFDWFDLSANFHSGVVFSDRFKEVSSPYYKYGFTISKEIMGIQPYVGYYLNSHYLYERDAEWSDFGVVCFGLAIPFRDDFIIPECNYLRNRDGDFGVYSIGIGIRASLNKPETKK